MEFIFNLAKVNVVKLGYGDGCGVLGDSHG
jgi:hypothetical protein